MTNTMTRGELVERVADAIGYVEDGSGFRTEDFIPSAQAALQTIYPKLKAVMEPDSEDWIEWYGGECPVKAKRRVDVWLRNGTVVRGCTAGSPRWQHHGTDADIVAYRVINE